MPDLDMNAFDARGSRRELARLVQRIQSLTLELRDLRRRAPDSAEVETRECLLERLRWQLAIVARRSATDDLGAAA